MTAAPAGPVRIATAAALGYLIGTFPSADLATRLAARPVDDLREHGSGNPGAVNAMGVLGTGWGLAVMGTDIAKGALASVLGGRVGGAAGASAGGSGAVVGHCYPAWNGFRGGKGVAASVGQCAVTFPAYFPVDLLVAVATASSPRWKQRALASTAAASLTWVAAAALWHRRGWSNLWGPPPTAALPIGAAVSSAVILQRFAAARPPRPAPAEPAEPTVAA